MPASDMPSPRQELAYRSNDGIDVFLLWSPDDDALAVVVIDANDDAFELAVGAAEALDVFNHPFAYAAHRGAVAGEVTLTTVA
jgi:hypothetical protein